MLSLTPRIGGASILTIIVDADLNWNLHLIVEGLLSQVFFKKNQDALAFLILVIKIVN
jgi:hypothetical protein